jgi:hypothetical protein
MVPKQTKDFYPVDSLSVRIPVTKKPKQTPPGKRKNTFHVFID